MLIAHLPSGYILGRFAQKRRRATPGIMTAALIGSVIPDVDMLYFHFVDGGRTHHHDYITHWPLFWLASGMVSLSVVSLFGRPHLAAVAVFFTGAMLHMVLDTVASPILWLMPFARHRFELVTVPASYGSWVLSFILHWTFVIEILICAWALWLAPGRSPPEMAASQKDT